MLGVFKVVWRLTNQRANDVCQLFCHSICNGIPTGQNRPERGANFVHLGGHKTLGVNFPVDAVTESSCLFDVSKCLCKFVFKFGSGVLVDVPVGTGVCQ